eukprot:scaffold16475_cov75-Skeletonema_dohrnii-CCMP3373.AAC.1
MADIIDPDPRFIAFAEIHDNLGWDNFVEGRISRRLVDLQAQYLSTIQTYVNPNSWGSGLIRQLLILTHQQWLYRNCTVHYKTDGRSLPQHKEILQKVTRLLRTDEDLLLPEDRDLLHIDFAQLGQGPTIDQERWIANMESAMAMVAGRRHRARRSRRVQLPRLRRRQRSTQPSSSSSSSSSSSRSTQPSSSSSSSSSSSTSEPDDGNNPSQPPTHILRSREYITSYFDFAPIPDTEGSLRYRRQRRRT